MSSVSGSRACPGSNDLSAAVDGLAPEEIAVHIDTCPTCLGRVEALRRVDAAIRRHAAPPAGLADRIRAAVSQGASAREPLAMPRWWLSPALRLAAAVAVTAAAIAVLMAVLGKRPGASPALAAAGSATVAVIAAPALPSDSNSTSAQTPSASVLGGHSLRLARAGSAGALAAGVGAEVAQGLPRVVRHVWTVLDAQGAIGQLKSLLPQGSYDISVQDGNTACSVVLPDHDLQKLVDGLAAHHWQLVSPDMPQPQKHAGVALSGRDVRYNLVMVQQQR